MSKIIKLQNPSILASYLVSQLFILIPGGDSTENHENCTKMEISQCESQNLFCCFIRQNSSCCSEKDYFNQFPKLSNAQSEARITPFDLMGFLEIVSFMGMTLLIVCCLLCSCCPNCAKHRRGESTIDNPSFSLMNGYSDVSNKRTVFNNRTGWQTFQNE